MRSNLIIGAILICIVALSVVLRIIIPFADVMGDGIKFTEVDSYYYMRIVDTIQSGNTGLFERDPLLNFPHGAVTPSTDSITSISSLDMQSSLPILPVIVTSISSWFNWNTELVAVYLPAIAGLLLILPIFVLCYLLWGKWTALLSTAFVGIMPSELLSRTSLGYLDNHCLELLFSAFMLMFIILALKKHWLWCIGAGIFLGLYDLLWSGALIINIIVIIWIAIQSIIYHWQKNANELMKLNLIGTIMLTAAFFMYLAINNYTISYIIIYGLFVGAVYLINLLSGVMRKVKTRYYVITVACIGIAIVVSGYLIKNMLIMSIINNLLGISGSSVVSGMQMLSFKTAWSYYGLVLYSGIAGAIIFYLKSWNKPENTLFGLWVIFFVAFSILWVRFNYYLAVIVAMFSGYLCIVAWNYLKGIQIKRVGLAFVVVMFLLVPNILQAVKIADYHPYMPSEAWSEALRYLKSTTNSDIKWITLDGREKPDFCVLSLWDYGYWIVREGHQAVFCSPSGSESQAIAIKLLTSRTDPLQELKKYRIKYIVVDRGMVGDKYGKLRDHTNLEDSFMWRLWNNQVAEVKEVFESKAKYNQPSEVRIYQHEPN